ncbi:signal peptidase I [Candidatus Latescibacterota bacterium]
MIRHLTTLILVVLILLFVFVFTNHTVVSPSMEDTLLTGDTFIVLKSWYGLRLPFTDRILINFHEPEAGDLVIFKYPLQPTETHVKRCVALRGQSIEIVRKKLFVDDEEVPLPPGAKHDDPVTISAGPGYGRRDFRPREVVPDTSLYVMGDNRDFSMDSRIWGFLPRKNLPGRAWMILWSTDPDIPWSDFKDKIRWDRMFKKLHRKL